MFLGIEGLKELEIQCYREHAKVLTIMVTSGPLLHKPCRAPKPYTLNRGTSSNVGALDE